MGNALENEKNFTCEDYLGWWLGYARGNGDWENHTGFGQTLRQTDQQILIGCGVWGPKGRMMAYFMDT